MNLLVGIAAASFERIEQEAAAQTLRALHPAHAELSEILRILADVGDDLPARLRLDRNRTGEPG
jgi:hypothetical protein